MSDSYFALIDETSQRTWYAAAPCTVGPWSAELQHGGPPTALAVAAAERTVRRETGRADLVALRLAADFVGPVPANEIEVRSRLVRAARSAALVEVTIAGGGRDCLTARVWFVRLADTADRAIPLPTAVAVPDVAEGLDRDFPYGRSLEWRFVRGQMGRPGPGAVWVRPRTPLLAGDELSGLARAALVADSASGVSSELDWTRWSFVNVDLDVHLARPFVGEWLYLDAATQIGAHGSALARSTISDVHGVVGTGLQTLVLTPVPAAQPGGAD